MTPESLLPILQLADGLFPAGGFAHSFGLETCVQAGRVADARDLAAFVRAHLEGSAGPADGVAVAIAARTGHPGPATGVATWLDLDARLDAMKVVPEYRAASRQMGRQTGRALAAGSADPALRAFLEIIEAEGTPGHHAVVFGAALGRRGVPPALVATAYLYAAAALLVGAGLRLVAMGQVEAQRILADAWPVIATLARRAAGAGPDEMWSFTPAMEIAGVRHADLAMRIFRS